MYNVVVKSIPEQRWFSEKSKNIVDSFNAYAEEHKARLVLSFFSEHENEEDLECALEEGMYDFIFPEANPHSADLKQMVEECEIRARFLGFNLEDLYI